MHMNIETNVPPPQQDLFTDEEVLSYEEASVGQRFLNYLIDALIMQYGLSFLTGILVAKLIMLFSPEVAYDLFVTRQQSGDVLLSMYFVSIMNFLIYYTICEKAFKGKTLGKLITGTRAVRTDGQELSFRNALLRTLSRIVPFEAFSAFGGHPWHDRWTGTMVIRSK